MDASGLSAILFSVAIFLEPTAGDRTHWERRITESGPAARFEHAAAFDPLRRRLVLFGGADLEHRFLGDTWEWDGESWTEIHPPGEAPPARAGHGLVWDAGRGKIVLFGGRAGWGIVPAAYGDTWEWDGAGWKAIAASPAPSPRCDFGLAYDSARRVIVLHGGSDRLGSSDETWELEDGSWILRHPPGAPRASRHALVYDEARRMTLLYGGDYPRRSGTWAWDGSTWRELSTAAPSDRWFHALAFDPARRRAVLSGGWDLRRPPGKDAWEFDGGKWAPIPIDDAPPRWAHTLTYDSARGRLVLFGGMDGEGPSADTWELVVSKASPAIAAVPADAGGGGGGGLGIAAASPAPAGAALASSGGATLSRRRSSGRDTDEAERGPEPDDRGETGASQPSGAPTGVLFGGAPPPPVLDRAALLSKFGDTPPEIVARYGMVNGGKGEIEDVLLVNDSAGDEVAREMTVGLGEAITVTMKAPSTRLDAPFVLYAWRGSPTELTVTDAPYELGATVFPTPLTEHRSRPLAIWNNLKGHEKSLGEATFPSSPAPSTVFTRERGSARPITLTFQGFVRDDASVGSTGMSVTNAVIVHVE